jgi:hypothetical protein
MHIAKERWCLNDRLHISVCSNGVYGTIALAGRNRTPVRPSGEGQIELLRLHIDAHFYFMVTST